MADKFFPLDTDRDRVKMELLAALLEPDDAPYPWNPADPESEAYFVAQEQLSLLEGWSEAEIAVPRQTFLTALDSLWAATTSSQSGKDTNDDAIAIQTNLQRFAVGVPQGWLDAIANQARQVFSSQASLEQQLVQCIQELVPNWAEEDLLVLARPFAYAMRGTETEAVDLVLHQLEHQNWRNLNEIEQTKIGLAIARSALNQIQKNQGAA